MRQHSDRALRRSASASNCNAKNHSHVSECHSLSLAAFSENLSVLFVALSRVPHLPCHWFPHSLSEMALLERSSLMRIMKLEWVAPRIKTKHELGKGQQ